MRFFVLGLCILVTRMPRIISEFVHMYAVSRSVEQLAAKARTVDILKLFSRLPIHII